MRASRLPVLSTCASLLLWEIPGLKATWGSKGFISAYMLQITARRLLKPGEELGVGTLERRTGAETRESCLFAGSLSCLSHTA